METIKKEKKANLEQLLNSLIGEGWKPRGFEKVYNFGIEKGYTVLDTKKATYISFATGCIFREDYGEEQEMDYVSYTFRELVSKESGLWQFVCDKGLVKKDGDINKDMEKYMYKCEYMDGCGHTINYWKRSKFTHHYFYEYFIIESSLKDESELEDFLLNSIKLD